MERKQTITVFRLGITALLFALLGAVYIIRLAGLHLHDRFVSADHTYEHQAVGQRREALTVDSGRGHFTDRNGKLMTGERRIGLAVFPSSLERNNLHTEQLSRLAQMLGTDQAALTGWLAGLREPAFWPGAEAHRPLPISEQTSELIQDIPGMYALPYRERYLMGEPGIHAIGYISQHPERLAQLYASDVARGKIKLHEQVGGMGLERSLDRLLRGAGPTMVYYDYGIRKKGEEALRAAKPDNPYYPINVRTTIDLSLQQAIAQFTAKQGLVEGAVVVLDAKQAEILAIVSAPQLDPYSIGSPDTDAVNYALRAVAPGSIFKLVTEAAALEEGVVSKSETFHCDGEHEHHGLACWLPGGHGTVTLREALALSCNVAFAQIAERLTAEELAAAADQLGIGRKVGWMNNGEVSALPKQLRLLEEEEAGQVFDEIGFTDAAVMAQTGIGQRDAAVTPLQAANLVVTLLNGGRVQAPKLVQEIRYANGQLMAELPAQLSFAESGRISARTTNIILQGMEEVVKRGTGASIRHGRWAVAGKSGTAQAMKDGQEINHQWFIGYGPVQHPRYAVAVLAANRPKSSRHQATALFRGVMDLIADHEQRN